VVTSPDTAPRQTREQRRARIRRRRLAALGLVVVVAVVGVIAASMTGGTSARTTSTTSAPSTTGHGATPRTVGHSEPPSIEAGVEPWQLDSPLSRESVVATGSGMTVLGGITPAGTSLATVSTIDPVTGTITPGAPLATAVHDAAAMTLGSRTYVVGGGSPDTVATVQSITTSAASTGTGATPAVSGHLPQPRSDLGVVTMPRGGAGRTPTAYVVGGYDGTTYLPQVLATTNGTSYSPVATLRQAVRYPAVAALGGAIYTFGGEIESPASAPAATTDIQRINPVTHAVTVVGHLPEALYGAAAFVIDGTIYVAGGQVPGGITLTQIYAFSPSTGALLPAGWLPEADAFAGYVTVGTGARTVGYMVGGEVTSQAGTLQAGVASGSLQSVISLRPSAYGGPAGSPSSGAPYQGTLLIADRGNDRLIALDAARNTTWRYPSATRPPPPGGFYFPDDAFFIHGGTGIISNQEDNHTIVEIGYPSGKILWQYGHPGQPGSAPGYLDQPDDAYLLKSGVVTVADASNNRILFISPQGQVVGQIGNGADAHGAQVSIAYPNGDTPLADGDVLVSEINGSWIDEYTQSGKLVWDVHMSSVNYPSDPQQLGSNLFLMTDYDPPAEGRVLEFTRQGQIPWVYDVKAGDGALKKPSLAERLPNGLIMVNDDYRNRVVVIDPTTDSIVWQYGITDVSGTSPGMLSIPDGFDNLLANGSTPTHLATG
jgi:hypothetical protein